MKASGRDESLQALIGDRELEAAMQTIARDYFPQPGDGPLSPVLIPLSTQTSAQGRRLAIEVFDLDHCIDQGDSQTAVYLYTVGRIVSRSRRCPIAAFLLFERPLSSPVDHWSLDRSENSLAGDQRLAQLLGLALDGRLLGCSVLLERDPQGIVQYCSEIALLDPAAKGAICDDSIRNLREFWYGFIEVIVDQSRADKDDPEASEG